MERFLVKLGEVVVKTQHVWIPKVEPLIKEGATIVFESLKKIVTKSA